MRTKISQLSEQKTTLEQYVSNADSNWNDKVKNAFFSSHVEPIRQSYSNQYSAMNQVAMVVEQAEREIHSMM